MPSKLKDRLSDEGSLGSWPNGEERHTAALLATAVTDQLDIGVAG